MSRIQNTRIIDALRNHIAQLDSTVSRKAGVLPFGVTEIDARLPGGGLAYGALHEFSGGGTGALDGAAAALFAAGIAARSKGKVLWCLTKPDLFFPAISQVGLHPDRVIFCEAGKDEDALMAMEEGLSFGGLGAVVCELAKLPMTASRRLQLAAEKTGVMGLIVRRWRKQSDAMEFGNPTASRTRWRISVLPSEALPVAGVGRARWLAELTRVKAGERAEFEIGACDAKGRICLLPVSVDGSDTSAWRRSHTG